MSISRDGRCLETNLSRDHVTLAKALNHSKPAESLGTADYATASQCQTTHRGIVPRDLPTSALRVSIKPDMCEDHTKGPSGIHFRYEIQLIAILPDPDHSMFQIVWQLLKTCSHLEDLSILVRDLCPHHILLDWNDPFPTPLMLSFSAVHLPSGMGDKAACPGPPPGMAKQLPTLLTECSIIHIHVNNVFHLYYTAVLRYHNK